MGFLAICLYVRVNSLKPFGNKIHLNQLFLKLKSIYFKLKKSGHLVYFAFQLKSKVMILKRNLTF